VASPPLPASYRQLVQKYCRNALGDFSQKTPQNQKEKQTAKKLRVETQTPYEI
jgi:hypothetical protein